VPAAQQQPETSEDVLTINKIPVHRGALNTFFPILIRTPWLAGTRYGLLDK